MTSRILSLFFFTALIFSTPFLSLQPNIALSKWLINYKLPFHKSKKRVDLSLNFVGLRARGYLSVTHPQLFNNWKNYNDVLLKKNSKICRKKVKSSLLHIWVNGGRLVKSYFSTKSGPLIELCGIAWKRVYTLDVASLIL